MTEAKNFRLFGWNSQAGCYSKLIFLFPKFPEQHWYGCTPTCPWSVWQIGRLTHPKSWRSRASYRGRCWWIEAKKSSIWLKRLKPIIHQKLRFFLWVYADLFANGLTDPRENWSTRGNYPSLHHGWWMDDWWIEEKSVFHSAEIIDTDSWVFTESRVTKQLWVYAKFPMSRPWSSWPTWEVNCLLFVVKVASTVETCKVNRLGRSLRYSLTKLIVAMERLSNWILGDDDDEGWMGAKKFL